MAGKERGRKNYALSDESRYYVDIIAAAMERTTRRLWIVILALIVLIAAMAAERVWLQSQITTESVEQEITQDADLGDNSVVIAGGGNVAYGAREAND